MLCRVGCLEPGETGEHDEVVDEILTIVGANPARQTCNTRPQSRGEVSSSGIEILPCGVFQIYKFSLLYFKLKKVMTFFLGMNYKFSLYIFQLFPKSPPILGKFDLKHQFTSIFTKIFPIYLQDLQIFPLSKPSEML